MIHGDRITLRPAREDDLAFLATLRNDVGLQLALMATPRPNTLERVQEWIHRRANDPSGAFFVAASSSDSTPLGFLQLVDIDPLHGRANLGICIAPAHHGTGLATEAMHLLESYAASTLRLRKICLQVLADNERAVAFYEKLGFRRVGILQEHHFHGGRFLDVLVMEKRLESPAP